MKRLVVLTSTFPRWRGDTDPPFVHELSKRLTSAFEVHVIAPRYPGAKAEEVMDGMHVHRFRYFLGPLERLAGATGILPTLRKNPLYAVLVPFFVAGEFLALYRLVRRLRPAAIHAHWLIPQGWVAAWVSRLLEVPVLVTVHGGDVFGLRMRPAMAAKRMAVRRAAAVTAVSRAAGAAVTELWPAASPAVVPMGVSAARFDGSGGGGVRERFGIRGPLLLFVGRLSEKKGVRYLLQAMPAVLDRFPDVRLLIVGGGEEEQALKELSASLGLADRVIFAGPLPNPELPPFYAAADIFVGPSIRARGGDTEGFGLTFVEAGLSGCILVGSDVGGIGDIIREGETGFLVPEKDPEALAARLVSLLEDRRGWGRIAARTRRELATRFDWGVVAARYADILQKLSVTAAP
ncbi:glycosyltransferase family 4 protein [Dissulfurirhabdus thermomarina]|uniref:Glycosyltransferase family 4 protein n=1 Tax=Dissulfurirhabdus thermomarina TaxID=1765737 RepID=A0A6N9TTS1_DISTH|nr:glycosyltransferase [Dissulfurirhabdus thermomarina]NDY41896.1 glycosyltransferase family 4 protein [Dissulfurirhabdus thermomarina]NMX23712.1 glycosyltransferase family 4 protein [Dissulfurirhabdus thermomarina]